MTVDMNVKNQLNINTQHRLVTFEISVSCRNAFTIAIANCSTSIFIGLVIFTVLGFLANEMGVEISEVAASGSGLAFVVYPAAISLMPVPQLWSVLFFLMLITIGFGSQVIFLIFEIIYSYFHCVSSNRATPFYVYL